MYQNNRARNTRPKIRKFAAPKGLFIAALLIIVTIVLAGGFIVMQRTNTKPKDKKPLEQVVSFDKKKYSLTDPASLWVVVNKTRPLHPMQYEPANLVTPNITVQSPELQVNAEMSGPLESLVNAAGKDGIKLVLVSGYRSYATQVNIYNSEVRAYGKAQADRESARPGYSEHQSGWAADLGAASGKCEIQTCFADTPEAKWLAKNAYTFGFIIRYAEGKEAVTGYMYEPWHLRYVGPELATQMHNQKIQTLEEFFDLPPAPVY